MSIGIRESLNKFAFLANQDSSSDGAEWVPRVHSSHKPKDESKVEKKKRKRRKKKNSSTFDDDPNLLDGADEQLRDWQARDRNFVENLYGDDLRKAIELSKVQYEKERDVSTANAYTVTVLHSSSPQKIQHNTSQTHSSSSNKEKKKNKNKTLSLEEFQKRVENSLSLYSPTTPKLTHDMEMVHPHKRDDRNEPNFFAGVDQAVDDMKRNEVAMLRFKLEHNQQDQHEQGQKDELIERLQNEVKHLQSKFKQVKKRNKQLLIMLQQGEMKEKSDLLLEIERLSLLQTELTEEVTTLNQSLEQEKSRSRQYKDELSKLQVMYSLT